MQVVLENINAEPEVVEAVEAPESQEPVDAEELPEALEPTPVPPEPTAAPAPKKRGRPPKAKAEAPPPAPKVKAPKPKAARKPKPPVEESSDSSDIDDTLRNVYNHVQKPDMETAILQFLVNRKQAESTRRRELWGRLAQF
jgi:hypothetical protein